MKHEFKDPKMGVIANLMVTGFCVTAGLSVFPEFLPYAIQYAGYGMTAGAGSLLAIEGVKIVAGRPIHKQMEELFTGHRLTSLDDKPPILIEKKKTSYGYRLVYNMPLGKSSKDFLQHKQVLEEVLDVGLDIYMNYGKLVIEVYAHRLASSIKYTLTHEVRKILQDMDLPILLGVSRKGVFYLDLAKSGSPHILLAGETGWGKSSTIRTILLTLIEVCANVEIIFIDLKMKESQLFIDFPKVRVIQDERDALRELMKLEKEMERRQKLMLPHRCLNLAEYNEILREGGEEELPYILVVYDEFGITTDDEITDKMQRIGQIGRSDGIHLLLATQRPDRNIVDGALKGNLGLRIAHRTADDTNSQIILDANGAELIRNKGRVIVKTDKFQDVQCYWTDKKDLLNHVLAERREEDFASDGMQNSRERETMGKV